MIFDTSAIVAISLKEPGFKALLEKLGQSPNTAVRIPTLPETAIVLSARLQRDARSLLSRFLLEGAIVQVRLGRLILALRLTHGYDTEKNATPLWWYPRLMNAATHQP